MQYDAKNSAQREVSFHKHKGSVKRIWTKRSFVATTLLRIISQEVY